MYTAFMSTGGGVFALGAKVVDGGDHKRVLKRIAVPALSIRAHAQHAQRIMGVLF